MVRFGNSADTSGRNAWKDDPVSPEYDYDLLCRRLNQLRDARTASDLTRVLFLLRISLTRNFARSGNPQVRHHVVDVLTTSSSMVIPISAPKKLSKIMSQK